MILEIDARLRAALPADGQPCGCVFRPLEGAAGVERVEIASVCVLHRRWLAAIMARAREAPAYQTSVKIFGPAYQPTTRHHGIRSAPPERPRDAAKPIQVGGVVQMDGPLYQQSRSALIESAPEEHEPEPTVADILGFDPSTPEEEEGQP